MVRSEQHLYIYFFPFAPYRTVNTFNISLISFSWRNLMGFCNCLLPGHLLENNEHLLCCTFSVPQSLMHVFPMFPSTSVAAIVSSTSLFLVLWLMCLQSQRVFDCKAIGADELPESSSFQPEKWVKWKKSFFLLILMVKDFRDCPGFS